MNVHLGDTFDRFVVELVATGQYQSQSEVVREGLRLLKEREDLKNLRLAQLRRDIAIGVEQADQGRTRDFDESVVEGVKAVTSRAQCPGKRHLVARWVA